MRRWWFFWDAYWHKPNGEYLFRQAVGPAWMTRQEAQTYGSGFFRYWYDRTVLAKGGRLDSRCFVWDSGRWNGCDVYFR
jgi:hypothetical protein